MDNFESPKCYLTVVADTSPQQQENLDPLRSFSSSSRSSDGNSSLPDEGGSAEPCAIASLVHKASRRQLIISYV